MAAPPIRIRIGAALDASVPTVFQTIEKRAAKMEQNIARDRRRAQRIAEREAEKLGRVLGDSTERGARRGKRALDELGRGFKEIGKVAERETRRQFRAQERAAESFARRTSHRATRFLLPTAPLGSMARSASAQLVRGFGVDMSIAGLTQSAVERQRAAFELSNQAIQPGDARNGTRVDPLQLVRESRAVADDTFQATETALQGLTAFVTKTGDLATGREVLRDVARLAAATGSNLADAVDAAGDVSNALGDIPDKGKQIVAVMRTLAAQGKLGAVEMRDLATQMAKIGSQAGRIQGDASENLVELGALMQLSRASGGSSSATQAATSTARLVDTLATPARAKAFAKLDIATTTSEGLIRSPVEVIKEALAKTQGDAVQFKTLFASSIGARPAEALANTFRKAGGGEAGLVAVDKMIEKFEKAALTEEQTAAMLAKLSETGAAKAQKFQNQLEEIADRTLTRLIPQLEKLAPKFLDLADTLGNITTWVVDNPKAAIGAAIGVSIARAGIESVFRAAIERAILGSGIGAAVGRFQAGGGIAAAAGAGGMGAAGAAGSGFMAATVLGRNVGMLGRLGAAGAAVGSWMIADNENDKLKRRTGGLGFLDIAGGMLEQGTLDPFDVVNKHQDHAARREALKRQLAMVSGAPLEDMVPTSPEMRMRKIEESITANASAENFQKLQDELNAVKQELRAGFSGTQKVHVTNQPVPPPGGTESAL